MIQEALESVVDLREADVPYHVRFCIDRDIRCGQWYTVTAKVILLRAPDKARTVFPRLMQTKGLQTRPYAKFKAVGKGACHLMMHKHRTIPMRSRCTTTLYLEDTPVQTIHLQSIELVEACLQGFLPSGSMHLNMASSTVHQGSYFCTGRPHCLGAQTRPAQEG